VIVRSRRRRMDLGERVEMSKEAGDAGGREEERELEEMLLRGHAVSTDMGSLDWKRMKIPPVLSSAQSARLFKTMQPMKVLNASSSCCAVQHVLVGLTGCCCQAIFRVQESLRRDEPTEAELAEANSMSVQQLRRRLARRRTSRQEQAHQGTAAPFLSGHW
jgi:RNA polymerase sigma factor